jgi:hypothetical protein
LRFFQLANPKIEKMPDPCMMAHFFGLPSGLPIAVSGTLDL